MFPLADTKNPEAIAQVVRTTFLDLFPGADLAIVNRLLSDAGAMFTGRYLDYQAIDLGYHDFEHTLQATLCFVLIFQGRQRARVDPPLTRRDFELGLSAVLLHDSGYLKLRSDRSGSSAKYTHVHVLRSGAFAASYAPSIGFNAHEADLIASAIHCTGPAASLAHLHFNSHASRLLGCMLVTADFLGQMAAPDYPDKLDLLYAEFLESDTFYHQDTDHHLFPSAQALKERTSHFWRGSVLPKLKNDFDGVYRYLASPFPEGPNPYIDAIERNVAIISSRLY